MVTPCEGSPQWSHHVKDLHAIFLPWISGSSPGQREGRGWEQVVTGGGGGQGGQTGGVVTLTLGGGLGTFGFLVVFIIIITITPVIDMFVAVRQFVFHFLTKRRQINFID